MCYEPGDDYWYWQGQDEYPGDGTETADKFAQEGGGVHVVSNLVSQSYLLSLNFNIRPGHTNSGQSHQSPPEGVVEGPVRGLRSLYFDGKDEAGVEKYRDDHDDEQEAELFISLAKCIDKTLETSKVPDHLEDPHDPHDPQQSNNLAGLLRLYFSVIFDHRD